MVYGKSGNMLSEFIYGFIRSYIIHVLLVFETKHCDRMSALVFYSKLTLNSNLDNLNGCNRDEMVKTEM